MDTRVDHVQYLASLRVRQANTEALKMHRTLLWVCVTFSNA